MPSSEEVVSGCTERKDCFSCVVQSSAITFCGWCEDQYPGRCMESLFGKDIFDAPLPIRSVMYNESADLHGIDIHLLLVVHRLVVSRLLD